MIKILNRISQYFGTKDISQYPILSKTEFSDIMSHSTLMAHLTGHFDRAKESRSVDWRSI
jgi:hypothetical protein